MQKIERPLACPRSLDSPLWPLPPRRVVERGKAGKPRG